MFSKTAHTKYLLKHGWIALLNGVLVNKRTCIQSKQKTKQNKEKTNNIIDRRNISYNEEKNKTATKYTR